MTTEERDPIIKERLQAFATKLVKANATPLFCVGIGHAPGPTKGVYVVSLAGELPLAEAYKILKSMTEDVAIKLGIDPDGVS